MVSFIGCGLESESSPGLSSSLDMDPNSTDPIDPTDPTDPTDPDSNTTDPDSNTTDPDSNTTDPVLPASIYDPKACGHVDYKVIIYDSKLVAATFSADYGIGLTSYYPKSTSASTETEFLADVLVVTDNYSFSFDRVWLENSNKTIYVRSPVDADDNYECYRYELNSIDPNVIRSQMVLVHRD